MLRSIMASPELEKFIVGKIRRIVIFLEVLLQRPDIIWHLMASLAVFL
jgi:hypothetical protein